MQYIPIATATDPLTTMVGGDVVSIEILIYWSASAVLLAAMDFYARKRLGKGSAGYLSLRFPRFVAAIVVTLFSIAAVFFTGRFDIPLATMSYLGVPYLAMWFFYLVCVFRRVRAEKNS